MSDTAKQPDPVLIATLRQLAEDNKDFAIADALRDLAIRAEQYPDMPSTAALQTGLGVAEQAVYRKLDKILAICEGNAAVVNEAFLKSTEIEAAVASIAGSMQQQEAAVIGLRAEFQPIAEGLTSVTAAVAEHTERIDWLISTTRTQGERIDSHEVRLGEGELDRVELTKRVKSLETTIEQLRAHLAELTSHA